MRRVDAPLILTRFCLEVCKQSVGFCSMMFYVSTFQEGVRTLVNYLVRWERFTCQNACVLTESPWTLDNHISASVKLKRLTAELAGHNFMRVNAMRQERHLCAAAQALPQLHWRCRDS